MSVTLKASTNTKKNHLGYLDSARGIAAIMVMVYHFIGWHYPDKLIVHLADMLFNGSDAVSFFFVLSGMVLSYKYIVLQKPLDIGHFYLVRFFRLWPAFFITMIINALYYCRHDLNLHYAYDLFVKNKYEFWEEALLVRGHPKFFIPSWTLAIELAFSFFMSFAIVMAKSNRKLIPWFFLCVVLMGNNLNMFASQFMLGLMLTCWFADIQNVTFKETKWYQYRVIILVVAFLLFSIRHIDRISAIGSTYKYVAGYFNIDFFFYTGVASFVFLAAIIHFEKVQQLLEHKILLFFGSLSYGIYLMHWVFVEFIFDHWDFWVNKLHGAKPALVIMLVVCSCCTFFSAWVLHHTIELPFMKLSKKLVNKLKPSIVV